jgi:hypothetical protein
VSLLWHPAVRVAGTGEHRGRVMSQLEVRQPVTLLRSPQPGDEEADASGRSWEPVDVRSVVAGLVAGAIARPAPTVGRRTDGAFLLYAGRVNAVMAESGGAKTWVALEIARQELDLGHNVVYVDFEDHVEGVCGRLLDLGADPRAVNELFRYLSPEESFSLGAEQRLVALLEAVGPSLVVIDSVGESMALDGVRPNDDDQVARWYRRLPRLLANLGPVVLCLDHVTKNGDGRGLYAIGSQRKRAAVSGAAYLLETVNAFGQGRAGTARLVVAKDRHGAYAKGETAARFVLEPAPGDRPDRRLQACLDLPDGPDSAAVVTRPTVLMERVSRYVEGHPGASGNDLDKARLGKAAYVRKATALLVSEDWLRVERVGPAVRHHVVRPFRQAAERGPVDQETA